MTTTATDREQRERAFTVHLIDGTNYSDIQAVDELDAVLAAGAIAGQDVAHLLLEVEEDPDQCCGDDVSRGRLGE